MTFKDDLYQLCKEVAAEFENWNFVSGSFKNNSPKHSELFVRLGFSFRHGNTPFQPTIWLVNKRCSALCFKIFKQKPPFTSLVNFKIIYKDLQYMPENLRRGGWIHQDKKLQMALAPPSEQAQAGMIDITEVRPVLLDVMRDGIAFIEKHYDLSSEENLLRNLPPKYTSYVGTWGYDELEKQKGVMMCLVRILLGDFDFIMNYRSDDYKTIYPKSLTELDRIIATLPELKKRYAETGSVI